MGLFLTKNLLYDNICLVFLFVGWIGFVIEYFATFYNAEFKIDKIERQIIPFIIYIFVKKFKVNLFINI